MRASTGSSDQVFKLTGEEEDADTGLYFLRARYMDPESGRFISRDLIDFPQRYAYANNNPVAFTDPLGLAAAAPSAGERSGPSWEGEDSPGGPVRVTGPVGGNPLTRLGGWVRNKFGFGRGQSAPSGGVQAAIPDKVSRQMEPRGWTPQQIDEAILAGNRIPAINRATGNPATRYVHPGTGRSVVRDNVTGEIIHVGGPGFRYGVGSGDVPLLAPPGSGAGGSW